MVIQPETIQKLAVHGHRGSRGTHPENTLPAFQEAVASGANVLELDLQLTADDVPVVSHDPDLTPAHCLYRSGKTLDGPIAIRSLKAADLAQFECGALRQERFPDQQLFQGLAILTLESFLQWWSANAPRLELNIETKMSAEDPRWKLDPEHFVRQILPLLRKYHAVEKTLLQSFDFRTLTVAKKREPTLRLSCLFEGVEDFCDRTQKIGAQFASPNFEAVSPEEVTLCHHQGIQVVPWTANKEPEWRRLLHSQVDAIITDYPRKLVLFLEKLKRPLKTR
jgi:glycerophosphoryl diester phosphodiesterase